MNYIKFIKDALAILVKASLVTIGAGDEARTRYLHLGKVALYRMSYARVMVPPVGIEPTTRGFSVRCSTY